MAVALACLLALFVATPVAGQALTASDQRAVTGLIRALGHDEYRVRASAGEALVKIGPSHVLPGMIEALRNSDVRVRANAAIVLGAFGPAAKPAIPALARALRDEHPRVRGLAGEALKRIASAGPNQPVTFSLNCH
jgi:HEAT repeat protein